MTETKLMKKDISPEDIKANLYDYVNLTVEIHGVNRQDIDRIQENLTEILPADIFSRSEKSFTVDEINSYGDRHAISSATCRRYLETESAIRYYSKDDTEIITLSRLFINIKLTYEVAHNLKRNIELLCKIVELFNEQDYFEVEKIFIEKRNSIYCSSLYRLYQCFDKKMFADVGYFFERNKKTIDTGVLEVNNRFSYDDLEISVYKQVLKGFLLKENEEIYEGKLNIIVSSDVYGNDVDVRTILNRLNQVSFEIFMCHITDAFARDLVSGKSDKVKMGLNYNG